MPVVYLGGLALRIQLTDVPARNRTVGSPDPYRTILIEGSTGRPCEIDHGYGSVVTRTTRLAIVIFVFLYHGQRNRLH
jgi:hypothetical protein